MQQQQQRRFKQTVLELFRLADQLLQERQKHIECVLSLCLCLLGVFHAELLNRLLKILVFGADLDHCHQQGVKFGDAGRRRRFPHQDLAETRNPLKQPLVFARGQEFLQKVTQSVQVLLIV